MADQTVRIENLPDTTSGSPARVAWDMVLHFRKLIPEGGEPETRIKAYLDLYADCHYAARGLRKVTR